MTSVLPGKILSKPFWRDAQDLWKQSQAFSESCDDYVARLTRLSKRLSNLDESMLRYAIITGFQPHIRTHVLQADVKSISELLQAARIAEMANTNNDSAMSTLLSEIRASNTKHVEHAAAFQ